MQDELDCPGCGMSATPDRLDLGSDENGDPIYVCPVCGAFIAYLIAVHPVKFVCLCWPNGAVRCQHHRLP